METPNPKIIKLGNNKTKEVYYSEENPETIIQVMYYLGNDRHREDGPAIIWYDGFDNVEQVYYYQNDKLHRTDGPAVIKYRESFGGLQKFDPPRITYALNGKILTKEEFENQIFKKKLQLIK